MSGLTFRLNTYPDERLDLSPLIPSRLASLPLTDILALVVGTTKRQLKVGDFFAVSGQSGDTVTIQGGSEHLDFVGAGLDRGTLILDGDAGAYAGRKMTGGELHIRGRAGAWLGSGLSGGLITVKGSAGDQVGSMCPGDKFGMTGGIVHVAGSIGDRVGERCAAARSLRAGPLAPMPVHVCSAAPSGLSRDLVLDQALCCDAGHLSARRSSRCCPHLPTVESMIS